MNRTETDQEKIIRLERDLAECYRLSGADPDGNEDWRLAPRAVEAVRELRKDYDDHLDECDERLIYLEGVIEDLSVRIPLED